MELTERKLRILQAIISDYVKYAEPVGSRTLSKKFNNAISSATIRNEMSDLEDMGYLTHPHTSAGRVPSDKAYRLYVNTMMGKVEIPEADQELIRETLKADIDEFDKTIQRAAELLSEITSLASFALSPSQSEDRLKFVNLLPIDDETVIMMIVAESGKSSNTLIHMRVPYTTEMLQVLSKSITYSYRGKRLTDMLKQDIITDFQNDISAMDVLSGNIMPNFMRTLEDLLNVNLYTNGLSNIFDIPEFSDLQRAKNFISLFDRDNKAQFVRKLADRGDGMIVTIGSENSEDDMKDCSLITATYHVNGRFVGKIGVIGPTRMKYGEIISVVEYLSDNLNNAFRLNKGGEDGSDDE